MDIIDNLIYTTYQSGIQIPAAVVAPPVSPNIIPAPFTRPGNRILSNFIDGFPSLPVPVAPLFNYPLGNKMDFCSYNDPGVIEKSANRHWYDINMQANYDSLGVTAFSGAPNGIRLTSFEDSSTYHLMYAYLIENTRLLQIIERFLEKYITDEELGIASNNQVVNWIQNAESLFFNTSSQIGAGVRSQVRPRTDATRRNAYWRMFGMDLAFGDINTENNAAVYSKAKSSNQQFVPLFEKYLAEIWQGYINARNSSGENRSDVNVIVDLALQLKELLNARRGDVAGNTYANLSLSKEEFYSVLITSWFTFIISDNTPVVDYLNCTSSTIGERLLKIGNKVGIPAHSKCQYLFEMAGAAASILTSIEVGGFLDNAADVQTILSSLNPPPAVPPLPVYSNFMTNFLTVINNWEKATGHKIKNPEANITGTVRIQKNGTQTQPAMN